MCSHYQAVRDAERLRRRFHVDPPDPVGVYDVWPGYTGLFIRRPAEASSGDAAVPSREAMTGHFGLIPHWARDETIGRRTYNARSETVAEKPSFRDAWRLARHCIIPADAFFEPDWRTGRAVATRISLADGQPMGIAGLWTGWKAPDGTIVRSYTMLTINAADHPMMCQFHKPTDEKRMVVILPVAAWDDWLSAPAERSREFLAPYPAERMAAEQAGTVIRKNV